MHKENISIFHIYCVKKKKKKRKKKIEKIKKEKKINMKIINVIMNE